MIAAFNREATAAHDVFVGFSQGAGLRRSV